MLETRKWRSCSLTDLRCRFWGEDVVVFHVASGDTHRLTPVSFELLKSLNQKPLNLQEIVDRMAELMDLDVHADLVDLVKGLVKRFDELGLIEPLP